MSLTAYKILLTGFALLYPLPMQVLISFLRGINVGGHAKIKMDALRDVYSSLLLEEPQTYVQSGNVIFRANERDLEKLASRIQRTIVSKFGCCPEIVLRSAAELRGVIAGNPFPRQAKAEPAKLHVSFLTKQPAKDAAANLRSLAISPEELHLKNRELYVYFPNGVGQSKFPFGKVDRALQTTGTARNWNSVTRIMEIAQRLESS